MDSDHGVCRSVGRIGGGVIDGPIRSAVVRNQLVSIIVAAWAASRSVARLSNGLNGLFNSSRVISSVTRIVQPHTSCSHTARHLQDIRYASPSTYFLSSKRRGGFLTQYADVTAAALSVANPDMRNMNLSAVIPQSSVVCLMLDAPVPT